MAKDLMGDFQNPGSEFRGAPFWAWNGKLDPETLRQQIRLMKDAGLGGFFMHSRVGLDTAYLSKEWFDCVNACVDEAAKLKMRAWLYDEDRWPSGAAGGLVTKNPKYQVRRLVATLCPGGKLPEDAPTRPALTTKAGKLIPQKLSWRPETVAMFTATVAGTQASRVKRVAKGALPKPAAGETVILFEVRRDAPSSWYNGGTYLDTMNHEAVRAFIRTTHDSYRANGKAAFGSTVPGIFTDEPDHSLTLWYGRDSFATPSLSWTDKLPAVFKRRYGYDLLPRLVDLLFDVEGSACAQTRYHYNDCCCHLFVDAFGRQIGEWCDTNKLLFTGHLMEEDSLVRQSDRVGACMRFYEHMQAPGMDMLTENWRIFATAKQVSSAARQFGRTWRVTETYGCTGWDFPFAGHKALGDWQLALGINLRCQHLSWYTMKGEAKRDYPAAIFHQSPWWNLYGKVEDYFARTHAVMTRGEEVRDVLMIHPVESVWTLCRCGWKEEQGERSPYYYDGDFLRTTDTLLAAHLDFDYGDEELLSRHGKVVAKRGAAPRLIMGRASYTVVVVPAVITLRATTLALLQKFHKAGGMVVFSANLPTQLDGVPAPAVTAFAETCIRAGGTDLVKAVETASRRVSIADAATGAEIAPALYLLREDKENLYLFICNTGEDFADSGNNRFVSLSRDRRLAFDAVAVRVFTPPGGAPQEFNAESGAACVADASADKSGWTIRTSLPALASRLFVIPKKAAKKGAVPACTAVTRTVRAEVLDQPLWPVRLSEANAAVLDRPRYRIGGKGAWQAAKEILRVDDDVRTALGVECRGGAMCQPWAREKPATPRRTTVELAYAFTVKEIPSGDLFLALEEPGACVITLNGTAVPTTEDCGWWTDPSLRKIRLEPAALRTGVNTLTVTVDYPETHAGLEVCYLLGTFGSAVRNETEVALTAPPASLAIGDWCEQGLAFYAGHAAYTAVVQPKPAAGERVFVTVPEYRGVAVRVLIDGQPAGMVGWQPNEIEITPFVKEGRPVELAVEVIGHRRNSHGSLHCAEKWPGWHGPNTFKHGQTPWCEGYNLVPCGLMAAPVIEYRK